MAAPAHSTHADRSVKTMKASMDALPVEIIGMILSRLGYAHYVAKASATCRKWHEAAKHHLHKLAFEGFNLPRSCMTSADWEIIITETLMRTSCLHELIIHVEPSSEIRFHAAPVIAWLMHTKKTLKSLDFRQHIKPSVNILEKLGGRDSKLEKLWWESGCITTIDPTIHRFESLVCLALHCMKNELAASNLRTLLSVCPKLESLILVDIHISGDDGAMPHPTMEITSSSLKTLFINNGFGAINYLILHMKSLECLSLQEVTFQLLKLLQEDGHGSLRRLSIKDEASIAQLDIGESASLLRKLCLSGLKDFEAEWAKFYPLFVRASNLIKLHLSDCIPDGYKFDIGLDRIALSFPHLSVLELNYEHACKAFVSSGSSIELPTFASVTVLKVCTPQFHDKFTRWITDFLRQCPRLERLKISGGVASGKRESINERMAEFTSHMIRIMRLYPAVDIEFFFIFDG